MFEKIKQAVDILQLVRNEISEKMDISAVEALTKIFSMIIDEDYKKFDMVDSDLVLSWENKINELNLDQFNDVDKGQILQFVLVGTFMEDKLQANYQITPDVIGMWVAYFVDQFRENEKLSILDICIGSGNLSSKIQQVLKNSDQISLTGIDNDDTMLTLASGVNGILGYDWELELADSVDFNFSNQYQMVIGDLPVGKYSKKLDEEYITKVKSGNGENYIHHLLIEKAFNILTPGGTAILLVPENIFDAEQGSNILQWFQDNKVLLQSIIKFPDKFVKQGSIGKELMILQKGDENHKQAKPVLLAQIPEIGDEIATKKFISDFMIWKDGI